MTADLNAAMIAECVQPGYLLMTYRSPVNPSVMGRVGTEREC